MKSFSTQFVQCSKAGLTGKGVVQKFKDYPELLPAPFHPAAPKIAKALKKNPNLGLGTITCLRFGGQCYSGNPRCMAMRAVPDFLKGKKVVTGYGTMLGREGEGFFGQTGGVEWTEQIAHALNVLQQIAESKESRITDAPTRTNSVRRVSDTVNRSARKRDRVRV